MVKMNHREKMVALARYKDKPNYSQSIAMALL